MLNKKCQLAMILLGTFGHLPLLAAKPETHTIDALLHNNTFLTADRHRLSLVGIEFPTKSETNRHNQCFITPLERFLKDRVIGQSVKVEYHTPPHPRQIHRQAYLKFDKKHDLAEFLLAQGWAQTNQTVHQRQTAYAKIEKTAKQQKRGRWGACDAWYKLREKQRLKGHDRTFKRKHSAHLSSSAGWVKDVLAPDLLQLEDGLKVKLQGVKIPTNNTPLGQCWHTQAQAALKNLVLGKKVLLEKDQQQLTSRGGQLQRYVWLPATRHQSAQLLNQHLVAQGWAQLEEDTLDPKYQALMHATAAAFWQQSAPPKIWQQCAPQVLSHIADHHNAAPPKRPHDPNCPIKGNISGSKKNPKKTYHTPLSGWYKRLKHEVCFADEAAAQAAGFSKVK